MDMDDKISQQCCFEWAGPALFAVVLAGVIAFFWWFLF
jgi:hypothetical protein